MIGYILNVEFDKLIGDFKVEENKKGLLLTIQQSDVLIFFLLFPFLEPAIIHETLPVVHRLYTIFRIISLVIIVLWFLISIIKRESKFSVLLWLIYTYYLVEIISTIINGGLIKEAVVSGGFSIAVATLCEISMKKYYQSVVNAVSIVLTILILLNFACLFLFPNGMYSSYEDYTQYYTNYFYLVKRNWILGYDNTFISYIIPAIIYISYKKYDELHNTFDKGIILIITIVSLLTMIKTWTVTGLVLIVAFSLIVLLTLNKHHLFDVIRLFFTPMVGLIANIVLFVIFIVLNAQYLFSGIIENILHKDITITSRSMIWGLTLASISRHPFIGYGVEEITNTIHRLSHVSAHNQYLMVAYTGGFVMLFLFILMIIVVVKRLQNVKESDILFLSGVGFSLFLAMWQFEAIFNYSTIIFLFFLYYLDYSFCEEII